MLLLLCVNAAFQLGRGDLIAMNRGLGWDGAEYAYLAHDPTALDDLHHPERARRILPSLIVNAGLRLVGAPLDIPNILRGFEVLDTLCLLAAFAAFALICRGERLSRPARWLGFLALFVTYPAAKLLFHYPVLTDAPAFALSVWMARCALDRRIVALGVLWLLAAFTWSSCEPFLALLLLFEPVPLTTAEGKRGLAWGAGLVGALGYTAALWYARVVQGAAGYEGGTPFAANLVLLSGAIGAAFVFAALFVLCDGLGFRSVTGALRAISLRGLLVVVLAIFVTGRVLALITDVPSAPLVEALGRDNSPIVRSAVQPGIFLVMHAAFFGPVFLLVLLGWRDICELARERGAGFVAFLALAVPLALTSESRHLLHVQPLIAMLCVIALDRRGLARPLLPLAAVASLLASKVWFRINTGAMSGPPLEFPWQRYFMNQGPWAAPSMIALQGAIAAAVAVGFWLVLRRARLGTRPRAAAR